MEEYFLVGSVCALDIPMEADDCEFPVGEEPVRDRGCVRGISEVRDSKDLWVVFDPRFCEVWDVRPVGSRDMFG